MGSPEPAAFLSYVRADDQHEGGLISQFRERLSNEVRMQIGQDFPIFQDRNDIAWGQNWQTRLDEALDTVTLLIPVLTPGFFASTACRQEVTRFLERERRLGRGDLILPVYYVGTPQLDNPTLRAADPLATVIFARQYADWRELRFEPFTAPVVRRALAQLAIRMRETFWHPPPPAGQHAQDGTARPAAGATEAPSGPAERPLTLKHEPQPYVVDPLHQRDFPTITAGGRTIAGNRSGNELIDQAFFSFSHVEGLTIVASSLPNDDHERKWHALLRNHVRLKAHKDIPPHALSYFLISPESAVVLRRVDRGGPGRNNSHALIGSPQVLTSPVALGLELWTGWQEDPPTDRKMSQLHTSQLNCEVDPAAEFRAQVKKNPLHLEQVLGWLLQKPNDPLSIIGCPQEERIALLWGLMKIGEPPLKAAGKYRDWTFSTYEVDHGDASLPKIVCLPTRPAGASVAHRTAVDLTGGGNPVDPRAAKRAHELVDRYLRDPLAPAVPEPAGSLQPEPAGPLEPEPPAPQVWPDTSIPAVFTPTAPGPTFAPVDVPASGPVRHSDFAVMVRALVTARTPQEFESRLVAIEHNADHPFARQQFRGELHKVGYGIKKVSQLIPATGRELTFKRLIMVAFGSSLEDFKNTEVLQYAAKLIDDIPSNDFARTLINVVRMHEWYDRIAPLLTRRSRLAPHKSTDPDQIADRTSYGLNERIAQRIQAIRKGIR